MVLACSRHMFVRPMIGLDQVAWVAAHVEAFAFFGGTPRRVVPENVPRNIFGLLCPTALCDLDRGRVVITEVNGPMPLMLAT